MQDAVIRVRRFMAARRTLSQLDGDVLAVVNVGDMRRELTTSDLAVLATIAQTSMSLNEEAGDDVDFVTGLVNRVETQDIAAGGQSRNRPVILPSRDADAERDYYLNKYHGARRVVASAERVTLIGKHVSPSDGSAWDLEVLRRVYHMFSGKDVEQMQHRIIGVIATLVRMHRSLQSQRTAAKNKENP